MPLRATRPCHDEVGALDRPGCFEGTFEIGVAEAAEDGAQTGRRSGFRMRWLPPWELSLVPGAQVRSYGQCDNQKEDPKGRQSVFQT
jgi:hypothetical protein